MSWGTINFDTVRRDLLAMAHKFVTRKVPRTAKSTHAHRKRSK